MEPNLTHYHNTITETENIVSLSSSALWHDLDLHWPEDEYSTDTGNTIVFGNFNKDEAE